MKYAIDLDKIIVLYDVRKLFSMYNVFLCNDNIKYLLIIIIISLYKL